MSRLLKIGKVGCWGDNKEAKALRGYDPALVNNVMIKNYHLLST